MGESAPACQAELFPEIPYPVVSEIKEKGFFNYHYLENGWLLIEALKEYGRSYGRTHGHRFALLDDLRLVVHYGNNQDECLRLAANPGLEYRHQRLAFLHELNTWRSAHGIDIPAAEQLPGQP